MNISVHNIDIAIGRIPKGKNKDYLGFKLDETNSAPNFTHASVDTLQTLHRETDFNSSLKI